QYLALKQVEKKYAYLIENFITHLFDNFTGAEVYGSKEADAVIKQIKKLNTGLDSTTNALIQMSLLQTLRDYQIINNEFVRSKPELFVRLKSASEGFIVEKIDSTPAKVLAASSLTSHHFMVRIEKPAGLSVEPGMAMQLSIKTKSGLQTRVLSIASSTNRDYLEFAVGNSESEFKKGFLTLAAGDHVFVSPMKNQMAFRPDAPAIMLAGGIGITPFRSMIQYARDTGMKQPMWLFYGNRSEIPFASELNDYAKNSDNLQVTHTLSQPTSDWKGQVGRIDDTFLRKVQPTLPSHSIYYIVGSPSMVRDSKNTLLNLGVPETQIKVEVFPESWAGKITPSKEKKDDIKKPKEEEIICFCHSVSQGQIVNLINSGMDTMEAIASKTNAGTGCGNCK
ncbi:MAG: (2Fe-2S)-binding protein, partial [Bdellovibrionales bacterium]